MKKRYSAKDGISLFLVRVSLKVTPSLV
jgi:hypothetical protein